MANSSCIASSHRTQFMQQSLVKQYSTCALLYNYGYSVLVIWNLKSQESIYLDYRMAIHVGTFSYNVKIIVLELKDKGMYHHNVWFFFVAVLWIVHRDPIHHGFMCLKSSAVVPCKIWFRLPKCHRSYQVIKIQHFWQYVQTFWLSLGGI
jgi:hypothetical protein